jgi:putative FmdB family regulatory protein
VPTYDYQCRTCGHVTEVIHSMLEDGPSACERCGGELRRVFHPTGIIFRGGGFYKTDSRAASSATSAESGSTGKPAASGGERKGGPSAGEGSPGGSASSSSTSKPAEPSAG